MRIFNNKIFRNQDGHPNGTETFVGMGIYVVSTAETKIFGNVLYDNGVSGGANTGHANIWAPAQNVTIAYNAMTSHSGSGMVLGGAENHAMVNSETGSNLVNKGHPDVTHQDFDGTRNDIGDTGGRNYIPNGTTTDKTIPISFSIAPQAVQVGGTVTIESTGATVK